MAPLRRALALALGVLLLTPGAADAGGWWSYPHADRSTVASGQRVEVKATVAFRSAAEAEEASENGRFYVYLLRGFDHSIVERAMRKASPRNWWSLGDAEAIQVGRVDVRVLDANLARASAAFTAPELAPATYHLMLCDAGCAEPLVDVIPAAGFAVVADPATAQLAQRVDRLERQIGNQARELAAARRDANRATVAARSTRAEAEQLEAEVSSLADESRRSSRLTWWTYAGWLVAGALAGALVVLVLRRRRSRWSRSAPAAGWHPSDEELQELLSSGSGLPR